MSGQSRRRQKTYREMAKAMLSATITDKTMLKELKSFGIDESDIKTYTLLRQKQYKSIAKTAEKFSL